MEVVDRPGWERPSGRPRRHARVSDMAIRAYRCRAFAGIGDLLRDSEHIVLVDSQLDLENLALSIIPAQRHRRLRRQLIAAGGPDGIAIGCFHPIAVPSEASYTATLLSAG